MVPDPGMWITLSCYCRKSGWKRLEENLRTSLQRKCVSHVKLTFRWTQGHCTAIANEFAYEISFQYLPIYSLRARFMGPTWGPTGADRTQVCPMLAPWTLLSGLFYARRLLCLMLSFVYRVLSCTCNILWLAMAWIMFSTLLSNLSLM